MKYRKKPVVIESPQLLATRQIEATQWFKNGDHPEDNCHPVYPKDSENYMSEGEVVRHFRHPDVSGDKKCKQCGWDMRKHGWIDTLEGGHIVCPDDWIITGVKGEYYPCKPDIFEQTYDEETKNQ